MTTEQDRARVREIIKMADKLKWTYPIDQTNKRNFSYQLMQLSEVEKCMLAMVDDWELNRLRELTRFKPDIPALREGET
jgi:hypothetical protein